MTKKLSTLIAENDYKLEIITVQQVGNALSRAEIEEAIAENGLTLPQNNIQFYLAANDLKIFSVSYFSIPDVYAYEKLTLC